MCQLYGRVTEFELDDLPDVVLEHKVDMCRLVLSVLDVIEPGLSRARGNFDKYISEFKFSMDEFI